MRVVTRLLLAALGCLALSSCTWLGVDELDRPDSGAWGGSAAPPALEDAIKPVRTSARPARPPAEGPIQLSVGEAVLLALESNQALRVERLNPAIRRTFEDQERAVFDPLLSASAQASRERTRLPAPGGGTETTLDKELSADVAVSQFLPGGTTVELSAEEFKRDSSPGSGLAGVRAGLSVTQALLRGYGRAVNLASLRQARLDTEISRYELRGFVEALVAQVERTYWDLVLAEREIEIFSDSAKLAEQQLADTRERIAIGKLAETELASAEAELASRQEDLINARSELETMRLQLLRLVNLTGGGAASWRRAITPLDRPSLEPAAPDPAEEHAALALRLRPELNQARLEVGRGELEVVKTKNGLLPKLDAFLELGKSGYDDSFAGSLRDVNGRSYDAAVGLTLQYPLLNRAARARHRRALFNREQAAEALANLTQLVELDVRSAWIEVERTRQQITATAATRKLQEEKARAETEKFRVGRSTSLLVAQAQRDLLGSQIGEIRTVTNHLKALVDLYRLDGSLLIRRGIAAPGDEPAQAPPITPR